MTTRIATFLAAFILAMPGIAQECPMFKRQAMTSAKPQDILFAAPKMTDKELSECFTPPKADDYYFTEVPNILDYSDAVKFHSCNLLELAKFLCFGFGTQYHWRVIIKPWFSMDPENKKPKASLVYAEFSF